MRGILVLVGLLGALAFGAWIGLRLGPLGQEDSAPSASWPQEPEAEQRAVLEPDLSQSSAATTEPSSAEAQPSEARTAADMAAAEAILEAAPAAVEREAAAVAVDPTVRAEAVERMRRIAASHEAAFPWVRVAWDASIVEPFDETLHNPCGGGFGLGCVIREDGSLPPGVWISLEAIRDGSYSDSDRSEMRRLTAYGLWDVHDEWDDSLERVLLHELAHVLDLTPAGDAIDSGDRFRAAARGLRDHYAGCRVGGLDADSTATEIVAEAVARLTAGHPRARWADLDGCLATLPPPEEHIDSLGIALANCGALAALGDDRAARWCPRELAALEAAVAAAEAEAAAAEAERRAAEEAAALQRWAEEEAAALAVACGDDLNVYGGPGWEHGCKGAGHIPDDVPCVVPASIYNEARGWLPGYFDDQADWLPDYFKGDGECRANIALTGAPRAWFDCLPNDGGRWTGDWTADPYNSRWPCPDTLAAECVNDVNRSPALPEMHWSPRGNNTWPPGWEEGCDDLGLIPEDVPCVVHAHHLDAEPVLRLHGFRGLSGWLPGYLTGSECEVNDAYFYPQRQAHRQWHDCLPDDGGRWTGDWTADPTNGRETCPAQPS